MEKDMLAFVFNGIYSYDAVSLAPLFIRLAVIILCFALVYDYMRRRWAQAVIGAIEKAGADSPENAKSAAELDRVCPGAAKCCRAMLKDGSMLRRLVLKAEDGEAADGKKRGRLTGKERFYIPKAPEVEEEGIEALKSSARRIPSSLREGGEKSPFKMIVGLVLLVIAAELLIYFFPELYEYIFENSKNLFS